VHARASQPVFLRFIPLALHTLTSSSHLGTSGPIPPALLRRGSNHLPRLCNRHRPSQAPRRAHVVPPGALRARVLRRPTRRSRTRRVLREQDLDPGSGRPLAPGRGVCGVSEFSLRIFFFFVRGEKVGLMKPRGCFAASVNFLDGTKIEPTRILLAVYPILCVRIPSPSRSPQPYKTFAHRLFYFILAWMILIS
jgi:hypothetical protein